MRNIFSFFVAFLLSATSFAAVSYELNGGVTNDDNWLSKADMWTAFCADAGVTTLGTLEEVKAALGDPYVAICTPLGFSQAQAILDNAKWDWLEAYIISVQNVDAGATALVEGTSSAGWRYAFAAFFLEGQRTTWPKSTDFAVAGTPEAFIPAWKHAFANPTDPTAEWVLNAPYKDGYDFAGWYTTAIFSGNKVTKIDTFTTGKLYAKWNIRIQSDGLYYKIVDDFSHTLELIYHDAYSSSNYITTISIPKNITHNGITYSVTSIGNSAFANCSSLTSVIIPNSVTSIAYSAFDNCSSLTSITIPNSVTSIGEYAFYNCSGLTSVTIPNSVTSIGKWAFYKCSSLTSITCEAETPPTIGQYAFEGVSKSIPVYVPCGCVEAYEVASNWKDFTNIQVPLAEYSIEVDVNGSIMGTAKVNYNTFCEGNQISATPNFGYHFVRWSDGNTDNPRSLGLTQDTILTAEFAPNKYTITTVSSDTQRGTTQGDTTVNYLEYITISATASYGYHFVQWNDGNQVNPRQVQVTKDMTYTATFDKNIYNIFLQSNNGTIESVTHAAYLDNVTMMANADYGYHFAQWSDGVTDNPRTFVITQDTTFTAEFAPNKYTITTVSSDTQRGTTQGDTTVNYLEYITISAAASYGYHFVQWNDGNSVNPRQVQVTKDMTYSAYFDKNTYAISLSCNEGQGRVEGVTSAEYLDRVTILATANYGYHFAQWSDGVTDNPRTFVITQDTTFIAEFVQTYSGKCGDNLYWGYANDTLTITGTGAMYDERPWGLLVDKIQKIVLPTGITHIGNDAFQDCMGLRDIDLPYTLETIGDYSFNGCRRLITINCYPLLPPIAESTSFSNYSANLYAPCDNLDEYKYDMVFGQFKYFECIGSESVSTNGTVVTPGSTDVTITWPTDENADTYTIVIMKGDVIFCKLLFNKEGQLLNIAFAPGRDGQNRALYAAQTANGLRFTVTGLEEKTKYGYDVSAQDEENNTISSYTGEFTTQSTTAVDNITTNNASIQKVIRDGQLIIVRNGVEYNAVGQEM